MFSEAAQRVFKKIRASLDLRPAAASNGTGAAKLVVSRHALGLSQATETIAASAASSDDLWHGNSMFDLNDQDPGTPRSAESELCAEVEYLRSSLAVLSQEHFAEKARWLRERRDLVQRFDHLTADLEGRLTAITTGFQAAMLPCTETSSLATSSDGGAACFAPQIQPLRTTYSKTAAATGGCRSAASSSGGSLQSSMTSDSDGCDSPSFTLRPPSAEQQVFALENGSSIAVQLAPHQAC